VENRGDGCPLGDIAGIQQNAVIATRPFAADHGSQVRKAAMVILQRHHTGVQIVCMKDGEGSDFGGQWGAGEQRERQSAPDPRVHTRILYRVVTWAPYEKTFGIDRGGMPGGRR
jgi:hypothetical protein